MKWHFETHLIQDWRRGLKFKHHSLPTTGSKCWNTLFTLTWRLSSNKDDIDSTHIGSFCAQRHDSSVAFSTYSSSRILWLAYSVECVVMFPRILSQWCVVERITVTFVYKVLRLNYFACGLNLTYHLAVELAESNKSQLLGRYYASGLVSLDIKDQRCQHDLYD